MRRGGACCAGWLWGELTVGAIAAPLHISLAAASKHVKSLEQVGLEQTGLEQTGLEQTGLVRRTVGGRRHVCLLEARPLSDATAWLLFYEEFWDARLSRAARHRRTLGDAMTSAVSTTSGRRRRPLQHHRSIPLARDFHRNMG